MKTKKVQLQYKMSGMLPKLHPHWGQFKENTHAVYGEPLTLNQNVRGVSIGL